MSNESKPRAKQKPGPKPTVGPTRLTQLRLTPDTLAQVAEIREELTGPSGLPRCSIADAIRDAIRVRVELSRARKAQKS